MNQASRLRRPGTYTLGAGLLALACVAIPLHAEDQPITEAETRLFLDDHLKSVPGAQVLHYAFHKRGTMDQPLDDEIEVEVTESGAGRAVETRCMTGSQKLELPPIEQAKGNPAVLCFLERDIREMERITGGKKWFFQKRIRLALADGPALKPIKAKFQGKEVDAKEIRITPFAKDSMRNRFEKYADKYYVFLLSDAVPGGILEIDAVIPDMSKADGSKLIEEVMTFTSLEPSRRKR